VIRWSAVLPRSGWDILSGRSGGAEKVLDLAANGIANRTESVELFFETSPASRRIGKAPVKVNASSGKDRTDFAGSIADGDDVIERFPPEFLDRFRAMMGDVHTRFSHYFARQRVQAGRVCSRASREKPISRQMVEPPFGHLAAR